MFQVSWKRAHSSKAVLIATQCAMMDEEEQRYNFVFEEVENEYDEEIQPEDEYNMMVVRKVLFSEP